MSDHSPAVRMLNLTPHDITVVLKNGEMKIPASGKVARVSQTTEYAFDINEMPVHSAPEFGDIVWPEFDFDTYNAVIVSMVVGNAVRDTPTKLPAGMRSALMILGPDTSPDSVVRDEHGRIEGVRRFVLYRNSK